MRHSCMQTVLTLAANEQAPLLDSAAVFRLHETRFSRARHNADILQIEFICAGSPRAHYRPRAPLCDGFLRQIPSNLGQLFVFPYADV